MNRMLCGKCSCSFLAGFTVWFFSQGLYAQIDDCTLAIGGNDKDVIVQIFQLNEDQQAQLDIWIVEHSTEAKALEDDMSQLLEDHPQSTEADLINLSKKYSKLKDQLVEVSRRYDRKLLGLFNEKQYAYYIKLCKEALRKPLVPSLPEPKNEEPE